MSILLLHTYRAMIMASNVWWWATRASAIKTTTSVAQRKKTVLLFFSPCFFFKFLVFKIFFFYFLQSDNYGFKCLVVGYEGFSNKDDGLRSLEMELSYLGGICAASLMRKVIPLSNQNGYSDAGEVRKRTLNSSEGNVNPPIFIASIRYILKLRILI